jgi:Fuc2NAc and GlcNAc transferase
VSRVAAIAIWAVSCRCAVAAGPVAGNVAWLAPWGIVIAVSFADDWFGVRPSVRLAAQSLAAVALALALPWEARPEGIAAQPVLVVIGMAFAIVWSANLFNFMDGNDGLPQ